MTSQPVAPLDDDDALMPAYPSSLPMSAIGPTSLLAKSPTTSDAFEEADHQADLEHVHQEKLAVYTGGSAQVGAASSSSSPTSPQSPSAADDPDRVLRYFHMPTHYAPDTAGTHHACATCNPHGLKTSKANSRLSVFPTNYISTTKYNLLNFLPKTLYEQFCKKANLYFLIIAILCFTPLSPKSPAPAIAPLIFVLAVTAMKEAAEDYKRYKVDIEINGTLVTVYRYDQWVEIAWAKVQAGDLVKVMSEAFFPADLVLLQSSANQGLCSIETANLDGETNLKAKQAVPATYELPCADDGLDYPVRFQGVLESDPPNDKMDQNSWNGNFCQLQNAKGDVQGTVALGFTQLLLRGCRLRNTKWIIGMVAFTGRDTKLMLQAKSKDVKRSNLDTAVDQCIYMIWFFQACVCAAGAIGQSIWLKGPGGSVWYLEWSSYSIPTYAFLSYFTYLVLMDILIPISLYVSMELVKFGQALFISNDAQMKYTSVSEYGEKVEIASQARTSNLNEELGQVSYIFSDKTGTLTRNEMKFLRCTIGSVPREYGPGCMKEAGQVLQRQASEKGIPTPKPTYFFEDTRILADLRSASAKDRQQAKEIDEYLTLLAVCHTVMLSYDGCEQNHVHNQAGCQVRTRFNAQSPDELALVDFALDQQYFFHHIEPAKFAFRGRTIQGNRLIVNIAGQQRNFDCFEVIEFTSTRKRCSVIVYDERDDQIKIYCKGADNVVRERLTPESIAQSWLATNAHLQKFASIGLRTLCCAYRVIPEDEFFEWYDLMQSAKSSMINRAEAVDQANEQIEVGFTLLGTTAIEDRLQEGVPDAIAALAEAGIKLWVLTGDKVETAINIGRSCRLLTEAMRGDNLIVIDIDESLADADAMAETLEALAAAEAVIARTGINLEQVGVVVSGKALGFVFPRRKLNSRNQEVIPPQRVLDEEHRLQLRFLHLCTSVKAVVCCRMSPKQKSQVVRLVKDNMKDKITLAIGDGANDVAMIEAAHVGIGIEGLEGKQAVMASDYSIGQFRFLRRLLLIHGAWSYRRLATLINYCFQKNITISLVQLWFAFYNGFSGQIFFDQLSGGFYNIAFTGLPILLTALFNRDISEANLLRFPQLYAAGPRGECFSTRLFLLTILKGAFDSILLFFFVIYSLSVCSDASGMENDHWAMSTALFTACVLIVTLKVGFDTTTWTFFTLFGVVGSIALWWMWAFALTSSTNLNPDTYGVMSRLIVEPNFWLLLLLLPIACIVPDVAIRYVRTTYYPDTAALGTLYVDYLIDLQARETAAEKVQEKSIDDFVLRSDMLNRQETVQTLQRQSTRAPETTQRYSYIQTAAMATSPPESAFGSVPPSEASSIPAGSIGASQLGSTAGSLDATPSAGPMSFQGGAAFTAPSRPGMAAGRHTVAFPGRKAAGGAGADEAKMPYSRSFSVGTYDHEKHAQTWQQLAKTLKQDSQDYRQDVGFTPFVASPGEKDFVMSGNRQRELSMATTRPKNITIEQHHK